MPQEIHKNDINTAFRVTINEDGQAVDLNTATTKQLKFKKPDRSTLTKTATLYNDSTLQYLTVDGDLNQIGDWTVQAFVAIGSGSWHSDTHRFTVYENIA